MHVLVGVDSPIIDGLDVGETGRHVTAGSSSAQPSIQDEDALPDHELGETPVTVNSRKRRRVPERPSDESLAKKKQELQIELIESQIYLNKLNALKLERELKITTSHITENLVSVESTEFIHIASYNIDSE